MVVIKIVLLLSSFKISSRRMEYSPKEASGLSKNPERTLEYVTQNINQSAILSAITKATKSNILPFFLQNIKYFNLSNIYCYNPQHCKILYKIF